MKNNSNELIRAAYEELDTLKKQKPSWEVYSRINTLRGAVLFLGQFAQSKENATSIDEIVNILVNNMGEVATIDYLRRVLNEFKNDMDVVSPNLSACLIKKLREGV